MRETYLDGRQIYRAVIKVLGLQDVIPSQPGYKEESDFFKITLVGVGEIYDGLYDVYLSDWSSLMAAILEAVADYKQLADMEQLVNAGVVKWLSSPTPQGAGLLHDLISPASTWDFAAALLYYQAHWNKASMGPRTDLAVIKRVKESCDIDFSIPDLVVRVAEMGSWEQDGAFKDERKKALKVTFSRMEGGGFIEATFVLEKRRVNGSLKDLAAEHVARQLEGKGDIELMDIPGTLKENVGDKFKDEEWIRKHREHIEEDKWRRLAAAEAEFAALAL